VAPAPLTLPAPHSFREPPTVPTDLTGLPIAITGASSGIGAATAVACARAGMPVAIGARRVDKLRSVAERVRAAGGRVVEVETDVTRPDECRRFVDRTVEAFGSVYAVFANAGYGFESAVHETSEEQLRAIFETNFYGTLNTIRPAVERMLASEPRRGSRGHVLICSSCLAKVGVPYLSAYSATKAAQNHIGRAMRHELEGRGVRVSTVHPIGTRTEFFDQSAKRTGDNTLDSRSPDWMMQPPERVADAVVRCLRRPRAEVWTSLPSRLLFALPNLVPGLTDYAMRAFVRKRNRR
jgi:short-subunit dehydrogenase